MDRPAETPHTNPRGGEHPRPSTGPRRSSAEEPRAVANRSCQSRIPVLLLLGCLLLLPLQVSNQSLWIDEGGTAFYALQPTLRAWVSHLAHDKIPNCQMPLSMFLAWVGAHTIGSAEWQFRVINAIWAAGALIASFYAGRILKCSWLPVLVFVQPYFWFYTDQARPYALEIFCGSLLVVGVAVFWNDQGKGTRWAWILAAGGVLLGYTTLLAPFSVFGIFAGCTVIAHRKKWRISGNSWLPLTLAAVLLIPIGVYYSWTIRRGVTFPVFWKGDWKAFCYVFYELTGLLGLGPPIMEMREAAQAAALPAFLRQHVPELSLAGLTGMCWLVLLGTAVRRFLVEGRWQAFGLLLAIPLVAGGTMTIVCLLMKKMLWARHWAPLFPFYVAALGLALRDVLDQKGGLGRCRQLLAGGWLLLLLTSALSLRFSAKHAKDDYRLAASLAKDYSAKGRTVYWVACWECAVYYGLPLHGPRTNSVLPFAYLPPIKASTNGSVALQPAIFLSRPSIYDRGALIHAYVEGHEISCKNDLCHAFSICVPND